MLTHGLTPTAAFEVSLRLAIIDRNFSELRRLAHQFVANHEFQTPVAKSLFMQQDANERTLAMQAVEENDSELLKVLAEILDTHTFLQADSAGDTPLHLAIFKQRNQMAKYLMEYAKKFSHLVDYINSVNRCGLSPLHLACQENGPLVAVLLQHGADPSLKSNIGVMPLAYAPHYTNKLLKTEIAKHMTSNFSYKDQKFKLKEYDRLYFHCLLNDLQDAMTHYTNLPHVTHEKEAVIMLLPFMCVGAYFFAKYPRLLDVDYMLVCMSIGTIVMYLMNDRLDHFFHHRQNAVLAKEYDTKEVIPRLLRLAQHYQDRSLLEIVKQFDKKMIGNNISELIFNAIKIVESLQAYQNVTTTVPSIAQSSLFQTSSPLELPTKSQPVQTSMRY